MLYHCLCQVLVVNLLFLLILACIQENDVTGIRLQKLIAHGRVGIY